VTGRRLVPLVAVLAAGCGGGGPHGVGRLRFVNRPPVALVNDRRPIPPPDFAQPGLVQYYFRTSLAAPAVDALTIRRHHPARDVNSLGRVPDSTWFTNRAGRITPEEVRRGPGRGGGPDRSAPWRVDGIKVGGAAIGVTVKDARGDRFIIKFDERRFPETESSADVIVQRLTWAFGYNVPENDVVEFPCKTLVLADDAKYEDRAGHERPMTQKDLDGFLDLVRPASGPCRALASRFIDGTPAGGVMPLGVRAGDPNDTVAHEDRRALRGQRLLYSWVDHTDMKQQNTFTAYDKERRHLVHYFLDFGGSLGTLARVDGVPYMGHRTAWGISAGFKSLVSLGLWVPPWDRRLLEPTFRGVGYFDAETYDPSRWTPHYRWAPFDAADRFDDYWAAVILLQLTPAHVRAAVEAGRYSDPRATDYVTRVLLARRAIAARWALSRVAPFEDLAVEGGAAGGRFTLCFDDLWIRHRFGPPGATRYGATSFDFDGRRLGSTAVAPAGGSRVCLAGLAGGTAHQGYSIVEIAARRGEQEVPPVYVHLARDRTGRLAVIGVDRR
jgi:hypothetical protein